MERSKLEQDRCILFPQDEGAVEIIESKEIDSRHEIKVIDFTNSQFCKLGLWGFFDYPKESALSIDKNSFVKVEVEQIPLVVQSALNARKQTNEAELINLIDKIVEKANNSLKVKLPIWFNT